MVAGPLGLGGVVARLVFALETSAPEQEPVPTRCRVKMELIVQETAHSKWTV